MANNEYEFVFTNDTERKVYEGLMEVGIYGARAVEIVEAIERNGIFFRDKKPKRRGLPPKSEAKDPGPSKIGQTGEERRKTIESQLKDGKYGPAYIDSAEVVVATEKTTDPWSPLRGASDA